MEFGGYKGTGPHIRLRRRSKLGRRLTRRLSLVAKMPAAILSRANPPEPRPVEITAIAPDKTQLTLSASSPGAISSVVAPILLKYRVCRPRLLLAGSRAEVDPAADVALLHGEVLLIEDSARQFNAIGDTDRRYRATEKLLHAEEEYHEVLCSAKELYARPLARSYPEFHDVIFQPFADLSRVSAEHCQRIRGALENWDGGAFKTSDLFPGPFWNSYWEYLEKYSEARRTLDELRAAEDPLLHFLSLRQAAARHSPLSLLLLPVQRLADYERYLGQEARSLIDSECIDSGSVLHRGQLEGDLHRIQELFPGDNLRLHERDVVTTKTKNMLRKRNGSTPVRLTRGLSQKTLDTTDSTSSPTKSPTRTFLLETPVQFTTGMQSQERHLFLFTDLLLIAKARSSGNFKLKQIVKMSELWLTAGHIEDVAETSKSAETSFVIGWPTTNVVATFMTAATRDLWWGRLSDLVQKESMKEPPETNIQVVYHDNDTHTDYFKTIKARSDMTAHDCVKEATPLWGLQGPFQLWARTFPDEPPYPLIGHERPFAVKMSRLRHMLSTDEGFDLVHINNSGVDLCHFILRPVMKTPAKKNNRSKITGLLRRSLSLNTNLFGVPLSRLDENGLPKPVLVMLQQLFAKGPFMQGIFRKSANVRIVRELREQIESTGDPSCLEDAPIIAVAALLKDFLRSLPDPLLTFHLFPLWMDSLNTPSPVQTIKSILDRLPRANFTLLSHLICVLHHVARRSKRNLMCASNLGVCCGPSLLWSSNPSVNQSRAIPTITEMLIRHCEDLFGTSVTQLLGEDTRSDSGAEESTDSLHSGGISLDSLELTEAPRRDPMSLSRDSGLTLSDCQLFIPESPVGSEDSAPNAPSSTNYDKSFAKEEKSNNKTYMPVYRCGWEERLNGYGNHNHTNNAEHNFREEKTNGCYPNPSQSSNFQRQDWLRAQLKRTPRTNKLDEHEHRKERFSDKDTYDREYLRQDTMKENVENCKTYRSRQLNVSYDILTEDYNSKSLQQDIRSAERVSIHDSEQDLTSGGDTPRSGSDCYEFKKAKSSEVQYVSLESPMSEKERRRQARDRELYDDFVRVKAIYMEALKYCKSKESNSESDGKITYCDERSRSTEVYGTADVNDSYKSVVDLSEDEQEERTTWPDTPPPLPPRLRHLPPVHMNLEDRHKVAGRSRSLPPPPPYRPPPQPRAPITTRHLGFGRSVVDDESYV
ncbi:PREDICTED: rho GTPase-activating protein 20-like isoform X1 [Atta colombica]|uniref:rho GTPase-activating protein 20-like isoform X1 n=1 Tax=Atta colombica TaxID=520822 RepID=UPI00084C1B94|nr:PREDICTED: rho GTPase-activating protein 20-like isoform X1 [Atta colombica]XP_018054484.1 PREDICTED: rho GTPase-activating protein 20-like isoform X1 [Atta colombica]